MIKSVLLAFLLLLEQQKTNLTKMLEILKKTTVTKKWEYVGTEFTVWKPNTET